jgi:hypothetical protein
MAININNKITVGKLEHAITIKYPLESLNKQ